jgi:hypothetical protein
MMRRKAADDIETTPFRFWCEDDFDKEWGFDILRKAEDEETNKKPRRIIKMYYEEWEEEAKRKNDPVTEAKLVAKYGGLSWLDPDCEKMFKSNDKKMQWSRKRGPEGGWCVLAYREDWDETDPDNEETKEPWGIFKDCPLHECLLAMYKDNPEFGIQIVESSEAYDKLFPDDHDADESADDDDE